MRRISRASVQDLVQATTRRLLWQRWEMYVQDIEDRQIVSVEEPDVSAEEVATVVRCSSATARKHMRSDPVLEYARGSRPSPSNLFGRQPVAVCRIPRSK